MQAQVALFTDGACRGNPGPGGWGYVLQCQGQSKTGYGYHPETTNNRMEMLAAIYGLRALKKPCCVDLTTDSQYLRRGITEWVSGWQKKGWKNSQGKPVKNQDLWLLLLEVSSVHTVQWHWVKGHSGHIENEQADALANRAIDEKGPLTDD